MKPRPGLVSLAFAILAAIHAWWGVRMLLGGYMLIAASQLVCAGALVLGMVAPRDRRAMALALAIAAAATCVRVFGNQGPFAAITILLTSGLAMAAWASHRLDDGRATWEPLGLRAGFVLMALAYAGFAAVGTAIGGFDLARILDFSARVFAALALATFVDAPPVAITRRRRGSDPAATR